MNRKLFGILAGLLAMGSLASATTVNCTSPAITNVVTQLDNTNACYVTGASNILFSNFTVSPTTATVGIVTDPSITTFANGEVDLGFQLSGLQSLTTDILLKYVVTGGIQGIDLAFQASPAEGGGNVTVTEIACAVAFSGGICSGDGNTLANLVVTSNGNGATGSATFASTGTVYIKKDIQFNNAGMSEIVNSHLTGVPEPMTLSLMGVGLLGLGLLRKKVGRS